MLSVITNAAETKIKNFDSHCIPIAHETCAQNSFRVDRKSNLKSQIWSQFDSQILLFRLFTLLFEGVVGGAHQQTTRQMKGLEHVTELLASKI